MNIPRARRFPYRPLPRPIVIRANADPRLVVRALQHVRLFEVGQRPQEVRK